MIQVQIFAYLQKDMHEVGWPAETSLDRLPISCDSRNKHRNIRHLPGIGHLVSMLTLPLVTSCPLLLILIKYKTVKSLLSIKSKRTLCHNKMLGSILPRLWISRTSYFMVKSHENLLMTLRHQKEAVVSARLSGVKTVDKCSVIKTLPVSVINWQHLNSH